MSKQDLLTKSIHVHPVFLIGVALLLLSTGALLGQTLFAAMAAVVGISIVTGAGTWIVLSMITILLGILRSFEVSDDAQ